MSTGLLRKIFDMRLLPLMLVLATPVGAHELWIEPSNWRPAATGQLDADLVNGEFFEGVDLALLKSWYSRFEIVSGDRQVAVTGRMGSIPALNQPVLGDGLHVVVYQSQPSLATYQDYEEFLKFTRHKDLGNVDAQHTLRGLVKTNFKEVFRRYSKALIGVGTATGADKREGLETEIVALDNPYAGPLKEMRVQVFYQDQIRADTQVEVFEKSADGSVITTMQRTDAQGVASIPVRPAHTYMIDAVVLRIPSDAYVADFGAVWETLWANLTFAVP